MRVTLLSAAAVGLLVLAGCGRSKSSFEELHPVKGVITSGGKPVSGGVVRFVSEPDKPDFLMNGEVKSDGTFSLSTVRTNDREGERKSGAPAGKYRVTYTPNAGDQTAGYVQPVTLPNLVTVEAKANDLKLDLPPAR